jgi:hypothetical protein
LIVTHTLLPKFDRFFGTLHIMSFTFDIRRSVNVLLFILRSMGGSADIFRLFAIMYISEQKHLARYGTLITGDSYIAMKNGAVPFNMYSLYIQLKRGGQTKRTSNNFKEYISVDENDTISAITDYNQDFISVSEAGCLFETIREYKNETTETFRNRAMDNAWANADNNNDISAYHMAEAVNASPEMLAYILSSSTNEAILHNENDTTGS